jgi:hypothetical protein
LWTWQVLDLSGLFILDVDSWFSIKHCCVAHLIRSNTYQQKISVNQSNQRHLRAIVLNIRAAFYHIPIPVK